MNRIRAPLSFIGFFGYLQHSKGEEDTRIKRIICVIICVMIFGSLGLPVSADGGAEIIAQPQNPTYNAGAVAIYSVTAMGENLTCSWYIDYNGTEYEPPLRMRSWIPGKIMPVQGMT